MRKTKAAGPSRDSFHADILAALNGHLDNEVFEACAADLLGESYPNLVPVRGGSDDGYDGAIYSNDSPPIPLITTTGSNARANLQQNLSRAFAREPKLGVAVFASARRITPRQRRTLENVAIEIGRIALRIYEQDWFANALYHSPSWSKKLLNLTGRPSALSTFAPSTRPLLGAQLVGRDKELEWLHQIRSDALVIAEPGAGKTFLLSELARQGHALFLADPDRESLANAIRSQRPAAIIVDDAHVDPDRLTTLRLMREQIGAAFHIIAVGWPGASRLLQARLNLTRDSVLELQGIDADTMVKIVRSLGIHGPTELLRSIVQQASGRPGLAATLADLCLRGDIRDVWSGESLARDLLPMLERLVGEIPTPLLACFSIGGSAGHRTESVAQHLGRSLDQVSNLLARLGSAGVIRENPQSNAISVWPDVLRWILVRDVFFTGTGRLPYRELLSSAPNIEQAVISLVGAKSRGAYVPDLQRWLEHCPSREVWGAYAHLGLAEATYVIEQRSAFVLDLSWILLNARADLAIPILLEAAIGDNRPLHAHPDHPLRKLQQWIEYPFDRTQSRGERSRVFVTTVDHWWRKKHSDEVAIGNVAIHCLAIAFGPNWHSTESDPGQGRTMSFSQGSISEDDCKELGRLWRESHKMLASGRHSAWRPLSSMIHEWALSPPSVRLPPAVLVCRREIASQMVRDLWIYAQAHQGARQLIRSLSDRLDAELAAVELTDFDILFPNQRGISGRHTEFEAAAQKARRLAPGWLAIGPAAATKRIAQMESEAAEAGIGWPRLTRVLFEEIAQTSNDPMSWFSSLVTAQTPSDLLGPFIRQLAQRDDGKVDVATERCLRDKAYVELGIEAALTLPGISKANVNLAIAHSEAYAGRLETLALREELSQEVLRDIMTTATPMVAFAAALGEWRAARQAQRAIDHAEIWRQAILHSAELPEIDEMREFELIEILTSDSRLAAEWMSRLFGRQGDYLSYHLDKLSGHVSASLTTQQRATLVLQIPNTPLLSQLARRLISSDVDAYRTLLQRQDLSDYHLSPLEVVISDSWRNKALAALDAGYTLDQVRRATEPSAYSWSGEMSDMWKERKDQIDPFLQDPDARISAIARHMSERFSKRIFDSLAEERERAINGRRR